ncbi:hypothetical protein PBRA_001684 [Plasmodiophora brassicae]|uniref:Uncharacterized protein n=1 Tax=Plasmodiophora brassicae TaxID=37360 RepID=A0A0G4IZB7_PLABS|nr:hypothetical protein PBRA_001684 [Plasmodiophora brassicae]
MLREHALTITNCLYLLMQAFSGARRLQTLWLIPERISLIGGLSLGTGQEHLPHRFDKRLLSSMRNVVPCVRTCREIVPTMDIFVEAGEVCTRVLTTSSGLETTTDANPAIAPQASCSIVGSSQPNLCKCIN